MQFELLFQNPYKYTSDDVFFQIYAERNKITTSEQKEARLQFFSKGQPCFRASQLTKCYGFGVHSDSEGKIAIYGKETDEYNQFITNLNVQKIKALKTSKK